MQHSKNALIFILITIAIDSIGLGVIIPSLPDLVSETTGLDKDHSTIHYALLLIVYALMQFLFSPVVGNLSDAYGRRPILLMSILGLGIDYVFMVFAPNYWWLFAGRAISGMFGASFTTAAAYIADISDDQNRAKNFGMIGAAFGIGFIIGPGIGAAVSSWGLRAPFAISAGLSLLNYAYGFFVLRESLPKEKRRKFEIERANPIGSLIQITKYKEKRNLFVVVFLVMLANMSVHALWNFYTAKKFDWTISDIGISLVVVGVCFGAVQGGLSGVFVKLWGEVKTASFGFIILILALIGIGLVTQSWMMYLLILPYAFSGIADPSVRAMVSKGIPENEQGELQGVFTSLMSIAEVIGPISMMAVYNFSLSYGKTNSVFYGSAFFAAALIVVVALIIFYVNTNRNKKYWEDQMQKSPQENEDLIDSEL